MANLQLVTGRPFSARCIRCNTSAWFGDIVDSTNQHIGGFADLDGEAFKAYVCRDCHDPNFIPEPTHPLLSGARYTGSAMNETTY